MVSEQKVIVLRDVSVRDLVIIKRTENPYRIRSRTARCSTDRREKDVKPQRRIYEQGRVGSLLYYRRPHMTMSQWSET